MTERSMSDGKDRIRNPKTLVPRMVVRRYFGLLGKGYAPAHDDYEILGPVYRLGKELHVRVRTLNGGRVSSLNLGDMGIVPYPNGEYNNSVYTIVLRRP